jgi:HK97 gp10 family phage protein
MDLSANVTGLDQLMKNLAAIAPELEKKALNEALVAGGHVIADEMAAEAPRAHDIGPRQKADQHIADSINVQVEKNPVGAAAEVYVGPSKAVTHKARWQEFGVTAHAIITKRAKKGLSAGPKVLASQDAIFGTHVSHPGEAPRPFMRPALAASGAAAIQRIKESLAGSLAAAAKKLNRKARG